MYHIKVIIYTQKLFVKTKYYLKNNSVNILISALQYKYCIYHIMMSKRLPSIIVYFSLLVILLLTGLQNFLFFHSLVELFSIAVAWTMFMLLWNARDYIPNRALVFLGIAYLFVALFDTLHMLSYKGMGVFEGISNENLATQLWIIARFIEASGLLLFTVLLTKKLNHYASLLSLTAFSIIIGVLLYPFNLLPDLYIPGSGLTPVKIYAEYTIVACILSAIILLYRKRTLVDTTLYRYLTLGMMLTIMAELVFTLYSNVYDSVNMTGHLLKFT